MKIRQHLAFVAFLLIGTLPLAASLPLVAAFALAPKFTELDDHLADHRAAEARLRTCRADVAPPAAAR